MGSPRLPSAQSEKPRRANYSTGRCFLARPARLERAASRSATWRSIQLSYGRVQMAILLGI